MYDATNRKQIRAAEKLQAQLEQQRADFLKSMLSTPAGRLWFSDLLESCHLFSDPFTGDSLHEAFLKGERNVGLRIFAEIVQHCPDQYITMMKEANGRRSELNSAISLDTSADDPAPAEYLGSEDTGRDLERSVNYPARRNA